MSTKNVRLTAKHSMLIFAAMMMTLAILLTVVAPVMTQEKKGCNGRRCA